MIAKVADKNGVSTNCPGGDDAVGRVEGGAERQRGVDESRSAGPRKSNDAPVLPDGADPVVGRIANNERGVLGEGAAVGGHGHAVHSVEARV